MLHWHLNLISVLLLLNGHLPLGEPARTVSHPIRHSLPIQVLQSLFGSHVTGRCTSVVDDVCNGTSVLNDGNLPAISEVSSCPQSQWADQLFTLRRDLDSNARIVLTFEVEPINHDRMELLVFNCPQQGIYAPVVNIYIDTSFRPQSLGTPFRMNQSLLRTSCDHLIKFCVEFKGAVSVSSFDLEFPYQNNSNFVFLGEVIFLNGGVEPCSPPELITTPMLSSTMKGKYCLMHAAADLETLSTSAAATITVNESETLVDAEHSCLYTALIAGGASVFGSAFLVLCISVAIHIAVYQCVYRPRLRSQAVLESVHQKVDSDTAGHEYAVIYEAIGERIINTELEMKHNEVYGLAEPIQL